jgi:hypothetical protein
MRKMENQTETHGITKQSMENEAQNLKAIQRITTGALSVTPTLQRTTPTLEVATHE